jgi:hypothetical protein
MDVATDNSERRIMENFNAVFSGCDWNCILKIKVSWDITCQKTNSYRHFEENVFFRNVDKYLPADMA